jgi:cellulose synthase/poly-beta-1,6-N-acetylglucosamine synthase-like glycosyltransferase
LGIKSSEVFFIVPARTAESVNDKIKELETLAYPFVIVCAEKTSIPNVVYRGRKGKYDAINYGANFLRADTKIVCLNDVDTKIFNFEKALETISRNVAALVFCKLKVKRGLQVHFYSMMDRIRKILQITSSGELMLIRREVFESILPLPPCKTEDNYISFKVLELGYRSTFCEDCFVETERTKSYEEEKAYKTRTVTGVYQALSQTKTKPLIRVFYLFLPFISPLLLLQGKRGLSWLRGIVQGVTCFLIGEKDGKF